MGQVQTVLDLARREIGVRESPAGSNCVKYNTAYYGREVEGAYPWCCVFLWWLFQKAGLPELFFGGGKTASCGALAAYARHSGRLATRDYRPGDLLFLRFSGDAIQHIGIVESMRPDGTAVTIEGNTGADSQANGGQVQRRIRGMRFAAGAFRPAYEEDEMTQAQFDAMLENWLTRRAEGEPAAFSAAERAWAEKSGIIRGNTSGQFAYQSFCTREQMAVFLYRLRELLGK